MNRCDFVVLFNEILLVDLLFRFQVSRWDSLECTKNWSLPRNEHQVTTYMVCRISSPIGEEAHDNSKAEEERK